MSRPRWAVFAYHTFGARALDALLARDAHVVAVVTHPDDPADGDWFESVAEIARAHRLPLFAPPTPNVPALTGTLAALKPDVILSVWYRRLLGPELLALPGIAALNLHGSLLPAYRGRAPLNWALVNGERTTGVTLHHMTTEADAGDIVAQAPIDIQPDDTAFTLYKRMVKQGIDLLVGAYPSVLAGTAPRMPQDPARATCFGRRRPDDGRIRWEWPAERIANMVRAVTHPFPGAFVGDGSRRLYLWMGRVDSDSAPPAAPGTLLEIRPGRGIAVATGDRALLITRIQSAGIVEEPADRWALREGLRPGTVLCERP